MSQSFILFGQGSGPNFSGVRSATTPRRYAGASMRGGNLDSQFPSVFSMVRLFLICHLCFFCPLISAAPLGISREKGARLVVGPFVNSIGAAIFERSLTVGSIEDPDSAYATHLYDRRPPHFHMDTWEFPAFGEWPPHERPSSLCPLPPHLSPLQMVKNVSASCFQAAIGHALVSAPSAALPPEINSFRELTACIGPEWYAARYAKKLLRSNFWVYRVTWRPNFPSTSDHIEFLGEHKPEDVRWGEQDVSARDHAIGVRTFVGTLHHLMLMEDLAAVKLYSPNPVNTNLVLRPSSFTSLSMAGPASAMVFGVLSWLALLFSPLYIALVILLEWSSSQASLLRKGVKWGLRIFKPDCSRNSRCADKLYASGGGSCLWRLLYEEGLLGPTGVLLSPFATTLTRYQASRLPSQIRCFYALGRPGHVSSSPFPGCRFGWSPILAVNHHFASNPYVDFGSSAPDADSARRKAGYKAVSEIPAHKYPELAGAQRVPAQFAYSTKSGAIHTAWSPSLFPRDLISQRPPVLSSDASSAAGPQRFTRPSRFQLHFPAFARRLTEFREEAPPVTWLSPSRDEVTARVVQVGLRPKPGGSLWQARYGALQNIFDQEVRPADLAALESATGFHRAAGSRGNRLVMGWESAALERVSRLSSLAATDKRGQSYVRVLTELWSRYLFASSVAAARSAGTDIRVTQPELKKRVTVNVDPVVDGQGNVISEGFEEFSPIANFHLLSALVGSDRLDPELALFNSGSLDRLASGHAVFLDAEGVADEVLFELIRAFLPQQYTERFAVQIGDDQGNYHTHWPLASNYSLHGAKEIFIHYGNSAPRHSSGYLNGQLHTPGSVDLRTLVPQTATAHRAILHLVQRHHCGEEALLAFDIAFWRMFGFQYRDSPSAHNNAPTHLVCSWGTNQVSLPRDFTAPAYFDIFRQPLTPPAAVMEKFELTPAELCWSAFVNTIAGAAALNWASFAFSMTGEVWTAAAASRIPTNAYLRNHTQAFTESVLPDSSNPWSTAYANTVALMYGYAPTPMTRLCLMQTVDPHWKKRHAPYFTTPYYEMWALQMLPSHQMLPLPSTTPLWDDNEPRPTAGYLDFDGKVRLARDLPRFTGRSWLQDGGSQFSAQHYVSIGTGPPTNAASSSYRFDNSCRTDAAFQLCAWDSPFQFELPTAPVNFPVTWMAPCGSVFADFAAPGSIRPFEINSNRLRALGCFSNWKEGSLAKNNANFAMFNAARKQSLQGVCVTYVHPVPALREFEEVQDYSMLEVVSAETDNFVGLVSVAHSVSQESFRNDSYLPDVSSGWLPHEPAPINLPGYLANHNDPGQPDHLFKRQAAKQRSEPDGPFLRKRRAWIKADVERGLPVDPSRIRTVSSELPSGGRLLPRSSERDVEAELSSALARPVPRTPVLGVDSGEPHSRSRSVPPSPLEAARPATPIVRLPQAVPSLRTTPGHQRRTTYTTTAGPSVDKPDRRVTTRPLDMPVPSGALTPRRRSLGYEYSYRPTNASAVSELPPIKEVTVSQAPDVSEPGLIACQGPPPPHARPCSPPIPDGGHQDARFSTQQVDEIAVGPMIPGQRGSSYMATVPGSGPVPSRSVPAPTDQQAASAQNFLIDMSELRAQGKTNIKEDVRLAASAFYRPNLSAEN